MTAVSGLPEPPAGLGAGERAALTALVERAVLDQRRNIEDGLDGALARIPRVLRGPVRRVAGR